MVGRLLSRCSLLQHWAQRISPPNVRLYSSSQCPVVDLCFCANSVLRSVYRVLPGCFALVLLPYWCLFISVAWCICPPKAEHSGVELFRSLFILELSCLLKTARIYFSLITITLVSGNFTFTGILCNTPVFLLSTLQPLVANRAYWTKFTLCSLFIIQQIMAYMLPGFWKVSICANYSYKQ